MIPARAKCVGLAGAAWVLALLTQIQARDFLPPAISVSQYGVGRWGWLFSLWIASVVLAAWSVRWSAARPGVTATVLLLVGGVGGFVMAVVRTDAGGLQQSVNATVHMIAAVAALAALPLGLWLLLERARRPVVVLARVLTAGAALALILLVVAAFGIDTAGLGPARSWAMWQSVATVLEMVLVSMAAVAVPLRPAARPPAHG